MKPVVFETFDEAIQNFPRGWHDTKNDSSSSMGLVRCKDGIFRYAKYINWEQVWVDESEDEVKSEVTHFAECMEEYKPIIIHA